MKNKLALIGPIFLVLLGVLCFVVVYIMYSKLSFIDTPYLVGGGLSFLLAALWYSKGKPLKKQEQ